MTTSLARITEFKQILSTVNDIGDARKMLALAEGFVTTAREEYRAAEKISEAKEDREKAYQTAVKAGEIRLLAEARLGELIQQQQAAGKLATRGRPNKSNSDVTFLNDIGLTRMDSQRAQKVAEHKDLIPVVVAKAIEAGDIPTRQELERAIQQRSEKERKQPEMKRQYDVDIRQGDFRDVLSDLPNQSVNLVLTDPPYGRDYLPLWNDLGLFASTVLRPTGALVTYSGQLYLPQIISALSAHLDWWWLCALIHQGSSNLTPLGQPVRKVINQFKPILIFVPRGGGINRVYRDLISGTGKERDKHNWQQSVLEAKRILEIFCQPDDLVVDPFAGSGTIGQAAKDYGCRFIGAEILNGHHG